MMDSIEEKYNIDNTLLAKVEMFNPSGSIKVRAARNMLLKALHENIIDQNSVIIEATSGNMGVALAFVCANIGLECAVFEPVHGSAPDIQGQNKANPTALLLSACEMLRYIGENVYAGKIEKALFKTLSDNIKTADLGGKASTTEFTQAIIQNLA